MNLPTENIDSIMWLILLLIIIHIHRNLIGLVTVYENGVHMEVNNTYH